MIKQIQFNINSSGIDLENTFECGQCFRWNKSSSNVKNSIAEYIGVINSCIYKLSQEKKGDIIQVQAITSEQDGKENSLEPKSILLNYLDMKTNYNQINSDFKKINDPYLNKAIEFGDGIHILNQDKFETVVSFIISANNNIPRIKKSIENICNKYGQEIYFENKTYYTFPTPKDLENASEKDFRDLGVGFRDKYLVELIQNINNNNINLEILSMLDDEALYKQLLQIKGIGPKVASCIMLFAYHRLDCFPVDVWVKKAMHKLYFNDYDIKKLKNSQIEEFARQHFKNNISLAQQYLFYYMRTNKDFKRK